jgi:2-isopropylmalate synthase
MIDVTGHTAPLTARQWAREDEMSATNHAPTDHNNPKNDQVLFFDTTLRDGEQSPGCSMNMQEKLRLAHQLTDLGVDIIEAGFAIASEGDFNSVKAVASELRGPRIASLSRCKREDIEAAGKALAPAAKTRIHLFLSCSDLHLEYKLRISREQALEQADMAVRLAAQNADEVEFSPEDATRTDPDYLCKVVGVAVAAGAKIINIPDTVGYTIPDEYAETFRMLRKRVPGADKVVFSAHCHDDLGLAVANSLAALEAGARQVECTINGIGERAGNAALEEIAAAIMVRPDKYPYRNNIDTTQLFPTSQMLGEIISFRPSPNKAIVGANAFAHEAGIHQHGVLANPLTYEIMTPSSVGVSHNNIVLGKHSGRRALEHRLLQLGFKLTHAELDDVYHRFTQLADKKKSIYEQDLLALIRDEAAAVTFSGDNE